MKKMIIIGLCLIGLGISPIVAETDKVITEVELPKTAQSFAKKYFADKQISFVKLERDLLRKSYEVIYSDGTKVEYNSAGEWKEVSVRGGSVPAGIVPTAIATELQKRFPQQTITKIEHTSRGYEVELSNGLEAKFDKQGRFKRVED